MALFSQRRGLKPLQKEMQKDQVDEQLRNGLWSALQVHYWQRWEAATYGVQHPIARGIETLTTRIWLHLFKQPIDTKPVVNNYGGYGKDFVQVSREYFFRCPWNEVYDFIEFCIANGPEDCAKGFADLANNFLQTENAAYRIVDGTVTPITNDAEITEVEQAASTPFDNVNEHISTALHLMSDRKKPDYRNSIKEAISAVEALCQVITGQTNATLGQAIKKLDLDLHPALAQGISNIYGYTSDADGIRHALLDKTNLSYSDAKFMMLMCSALVNYLIGKKAERK